MRRICTESSERDSAGMGCASEISDRAVGMAFPLCGLDYGDMDVVSVVSVDGQGLAAHGLWIGMALEKVMVAGE